MPEEGEISLLGFTRWWQKHHYVNWLWRWFIAPTDYAAEALVENLARIFFRLFPSGLHFFLLVKLRNGIPPTRSDSTVPAI
jgi:hypothetical protein